ncbi:MAG: hypothetical protein KJ760_00675, partial [Proteobacteria bacterium]|nr:hypothetical protein [Pseudomonadota bacterium]
LKAVILVSMLAAPVSSVANGRMDVNVVVPMPPPFVVAGPLHVVVIPQTYVYAVPDADVDIFFFSGWWWRPWQGRWYRSHDYRSGWVYYGNAPAFYRQVPPTWRSDYRQNRWKGQHWEHRRIPVHSVVRDWHRWEKDKYWEKQNHQINRPYQHEKKQNTYVREQPRPEARQKQYQQRDRDKEKNNHARPQRAQNWQNTHDRKDMKRL